MMIYILYIYLKKTLGSSVKQLYTSLELRMSDRKKASLQGLSSFINFFIIQGPHPQTFMMKALGLYRIPSLKCSLNG